MSFSFRRWGTAVAALLFLILPLASSGAESLQQQVRTWRINNERALIDEYREFLAIPCTTIDRANIRRNADFLLGMLRRRGVEARLLTPRVSNSNPVVYGELKVPGATRTILLYAHLDGQPVNPAQWAPGWEPFGAKFATAPAEQGGKLVDWKPGDPVDPEWRLIGRGAADDKAGVTVILNALSAIQASGVKPTANLRFFFDGEEEVGSPNLAALIEAHRDLLSADLWLILDGPCHPSGRKTVVHGVRGNLNLDVTVYGARRPLHSGNYGNWAPNPTWQLVNLLATMKDANGRVLIEGFYDDVTPLSADEQAAVAAIPSVEAELAAELALAQPEVPGRTLYEGFNLPSLNINGFQAGGVGAQAANIIPTTAQVSIGLRLVPGNDARRQATKVIEHIRRQGWHVIDRDPTDEERARHPRLIRVRHGAGTNAQRTPMNHPVARAVVAAVQSTVNYPVVKLPSLGGTLPLVVIERMLGSPVLTVPVVNADNNQHAENENVKVRFLWDGIETYAALLTMP